MNQIFPHLHKFLANSLAVWDFSFLSILIFHLMNIGFNMQETPLFFRSSFEDTPSLLHRYSIASPSFRWSIDGGLMDYRWSILGVSKEEFVCLRLEN